MSKGIVWPCERCGHGTELSPMMTQHKPEYDLIEYSGECDGEKDETTDCGNIVTVVIREEPSEESPYYMEPA